ncbi:Gfo/Idh/MocA family protein [Paenibacillus psychroresistens]|nr:Gfo/Idh/MocA family oxidoreductase [Paenibacillus psychroresistens]
MKKLKVGLVGIGRGTAYGRLFAGNNKTIVTALCDTHSESLESCGRQFGLHDNQLFDNYDDLVNSDADIIVIGTPIPVHADQAIKALECNKHVLCEVTAANTLQDCERLFYAVQRSKGKYMLAENCNYMHFALEWNKLIKQGNLGNIYYAEADYVHEIRIAVEGQWRAQRAPLHYCSHSLGPLLLWMDDYIVKATGSGKATSIMGDIGVGAIDMQVALFETNKGATIKVLRSSVATRQPELCAYSVYGTKGFLETGRTGYDNIGLRYFEGLDEKTGKKIAVSSSNPDAPKDSGLGGHGTSEFFLVKDFINAIENDVPPAIDIVKALDMTIPGLIAHESAVKGNIWLDVPRFI